jgi:cob(I)alamin adenosyltransferase
MSTNRITTEYEEGASLGDLGYSNLLVGETVSKGSAFASVYSSVERLQHELDSYVYTRSGNYSPIMMNQIEVNDAEFLEWLFEALFSLSSFCYRKGYTLEEYGLMFPESAYQFMVDRIEYFKSLEEESQTEFIRLGGDLNLLRILVRDVERNFSAWTNENEIVKQERIKPGVKANILRQQRFLNRLSSYFYWLTRNVEAKAGRKHTQWITRVPHFSYVSKNQFSDDN